MRKIKVRINNIETRNLNNGTSAIIIEKAKKRHSSKIWDETNNKEIHKKDKVFGDKSKPMDRIEILCPTIKANKIYGLILLKKILKSQAASEKNEWWIYIKNIEEKINGSNSSPRWWKNSGADKTRTLHIENVSLASNAEDIIDIGFDNEKIEFLKLESLLDKLGNHFKNNTGDIASYTSLDDDIKYLESFVNKAGPDKLGTSTDPTKKSKETIYNINEDGSVGKQIYKKKIDDWVKKLREYWVWHKIIGLQKLEEIPKNNEDIFNKFDLTNSTVINELKNWFPNPDRKYKGFDILKYHWVQISNFRHKNWFGGSQYRAKTEPDECRGFQPEDIDKTSPPSYLGGHGENMTTDLGGGRKITKIYMDILVAPDLDAAIDLAFFGMPYKDMIGTKPGTNDYDRKNLLYFNEIRGENKKNLLDIYLAAIKHTNCGWNAMNYNKSPAGFGGNDWADKNWQSNAPGVRDKVQKAYEEIRNFLDLIDIVYKNYNADKKNELKKAKNELNVYLNPTANDKYKQKIKNRWETQITKKIHEINVHLRDLEKNKENEDPCNSLQAEITVAKKAKYADNQSLDNNEKTIFDNTANHELLTKKKILVELLKKALKNTLTDRHDKETFDKLNNYKNSSDKKEKEAWEAAEKIKVNNEGWGTRAINNLETNEAKRIVKKSLSDDNLFNKIFSSLAKKNIVEKAKEILDEVRKVDDKISSNDSLLVKLQDFQTYHPTAWKAVNNDNGRATSALNKLKCFREKVIDCKEKLKNLKTKEEINSKFSAIMTSQNYQNLSEEEKQKVIKYKDYQLTRAEIENSNEWNKEQKQLAYETFVEDYVDSNDKEKLIKIITGVEKYKNSSNEKEKKFYTSYQAHWDEKLTEIKFRYQTLVKNEKNSEFAKNKGQQNPEVNQSKGKIPDWGIILIAVGIITILAIIGYYIIKKKAFSKKVK